MALVRSFTKENRHCLHRHRERVEKLFHVASLEMPVGLGYRYPLDFSSFLPHPHMNPLPSAGI